MTIWKNRSQIKARSPKKIKIKLRLQKKIQTKGSESSNVPSPRVGQTDTQSRPGPSNDGNMNRNAQILALPKGIEENQNTQGQETKSLSARMN